MLPKTPIMLDGTRVSLRPLEPHHAATLFEIGKGVNIWQWYPDRIESIEDMERIVAQALAARELGLALPFVIVDRQTHAIIGSSRFFNVFPDHRRLEIGWTWIGTQWQRTSVNTEAKYLMLRYAFEVMNCLRVELKTDSRNVNSQQAMLRLGLKQEGILRNHMITHDGHNRDSVYFSVVAPEWPPMQEFIESKLECWAINPRFHVSPAHL
ncbi:MAG: GNAT family protein [Proteobacteria bacterium]|nr:GNAT family protein [Pseudomonadota bacterium]